MSLAADRRPSLRLVIVLAHLVALALTARAAAQDRAGGDRQTEVDPAPDPTAQRPRAGEQVLPAIPVVVCLAEPMYQRAFSMMSMGQYDVAHELLVRVARVCPGHPFVREMLRLVRAMSSYAEAVEDRGGTAPLRPGAAAQPARPSLTAPESPTGLARAELIGVHGLIGTVHGALFCPMFVSNFGSSGGCSAEGVIGAMLLGGALGSGVATVASWSGIRPGQAMVVEAGSFWGSYNGFMLALAVSDGFRFGRGVVSGAIFESGLALGLGAGILTAVLARPRAGHIALINSGAFWGGVSGFAAWAISLGACCSSAVGFAASQLIGVNLGMLMAAVGGAFYPTSRLRMLLVDLGTLLGGAVGVGLGTIIAVASRSTSATGPIIGVSSLLGILGGFATTMVITHRFDHPAAAEPPRGARMSLAPSGPGDGPGLTMGVTF